MSDILIDINYIKREIKSMSKKIKTNELQFTCFYFLFCRIYFS